MKFFREHGRCAGNLSLEEIERLLAEGAEHLRPMVPVAPHTGMRRGEVLSLTWEQVDLAGGVITLTRTKSGKVRKVPINGVVGKLLKGLPRVGPFVFGGERAWKDVKNGWRGACRRAGLAGLRFHDLRHTWATYMVQARVDLRTLQELGGWCTLAMVERYTHPTPEAKRRAVEAVGGAMSAASPHKTGTPVVPAVASVAVSVRP